jgi:signal transduction histidine kinase
MPSNIAEALLGERTDMARVHRRVVRVGAVAALLAAALFLLTGFATGDETFLIQALGPILAAGLMTAQILLDRENGGIALFGSAVVVVVVHGVAGSEQSLIAAAVALVVICSLGMLFIDRSPVSAGIGIALILMATPALWGIAPGEAIVLGVVMTGGFAVTAAVFLSVRSAVSAVNNRLRILFDRSPTAVLEEDWAEAIEYVRSEYSGRPERIRQFLLAYPEVVRRAVSLAKVRRVNRAAMDLLEARGPREVLGHRDGSKVTRGDLESYVDTLVALYNGHGFFEHEFLTHTLRGHPIWLQARCVDDTLGASPEAVLVALADISHIRAREEAFAELIKAKDAFIASISHELRTPLTAVLGLTYEMAGEDMGDPERRELTQMVFGQAEEMAYIVEDLLVAARAEIGTVSVEPSTVELGEELRVALEGVQMTSIETPTGLPTVFADPMRVRQILRNLLTNVDRYGGETRRILGGQVDERAWIEIRDDGPGVTAQDAGRIFEPYVTAHTGVAGSVGLGLSVARQLAVLMGGSLSYRREGDESVFRLELPVDRAAAMVSSSRDVRE